MMADADGEITGTPQAVKPAHTKIVVEREADALVIRMPACGVRGIAVLALLAALGLTGFAIVFTVIAVAADADAAPPVVVPVALWLAAVVAVALAAIAIALRVFVRMEGGALTIRKSAFGLGRTRRYPLGREAKATLAASSLQRSRIIRCVSVSTGAGEVRFGEAFTGAEKEWLVGQINGLLAARSDSEGQ